MVEIYVDFNEVSPDGYGYSLRRLLRTPLAARMAVMAVDADGNRCPGVVAEITEKMIKVELNMDRFEDVEDRALAAAR